MRRRGRRGDRPALTGGLAGYSRTPALAVPTPDGTCPEPVRSGARTAHVSPLLPMPRSAAADRRSREHARSARGRVTAPLAAAPRPDGAEATETWDFGFWILDFGLPNRLLGLCRQRARRRAGGAPRARG